MKGRDMPRVRCCLAAALCLVLSAPGLWASDFDGQPDVRLERLRQHMEGLVHANARALIDEQASDREKADVALVIGAFLLMGRMGEADPIGAMDFFQRASELGSAEADTALANLYNAGAESPSGSIPRDPKLSLSYYEMAAAGGSVAALLQLGDIYAEGRNVDPDSKKALGYYMEAAKRGDKEALSRLEPVMRNAREWEAAKPGRKANFPTSAEAIVDKRLAKEAEDRNAAIDRLASRIYVELNKRVAASSGVDRQK